MDVAGVELARYFEQSGRDAILFLLEELERNRAFVMRLHEFVALTFQFLLLSLEVASLDYRVGARGLELLDEHGLDCEPELRVEGDVLVVLLDAGFDLVDENGFLPTVGALAVPPGAHEVWVVDAGAGLGYLHK
ncbi:MAG TPA: hypothetical protein VIL06_08800 [Coriobacteriia bacterium]